MRIKRLHPWNVSSQRAIQIQADLRGEIIQVDEMGKITVVAGVDVGFESDGEITRAGVALLEFPSLEVIETAIASQPTNFPYVPGLLSFREAPAICEALTNLSCTPDLIICDGHGLAHPRRFGLACHIGLLSGTPTIGVAKSLLIGEHQPVGQKRGDWSYLLDDGGVIGLVLRTRTKVKPVYVSIGHKISLGTAAELILQCAPRYRIPEPIRQAHRLASG
jgi:deoxyribonuclease V